jgi:hypothetical protein
VTKEEAMALVHLLDKKIFAWTDPTSRKPCCFGAQAPAHGASHRGGRLVFACGTDWKVAAQEYYRSQEIRPERWPAALRAHRAQAPPISPTPEAPPRR